MNRARTPEADVEGSPHLVVRAEDRAIVEDALADLLIAALEREESESA